MSISSNPSYQLLDRHMRSLKRPAKVSIHSVNTSTSVYARESKIELELKYTDAEFWDIVELPFIEGAPYTIDQVTNADAVAVITDRTQKQVFGAGRVVGEYLESTSGTFRVVGVVSQQDMPGQTVYADVWVPITQSTVTMTRTEPYGSEQGIVLPATDEDIPAIKAEFERHLDVVRADVAARFDTVSCKMMSPTEKAAYVFIGSDHTPALAIALVFGLMLLFMLLPAVNLVNMTVSRIYERSSEIGVRKAFGASSATLIGQFVIENVVLTLVGGGLAVVFSLVVLGILNSSGLMPFAQFRLNLHVLFYSLLISLFFGVFSGVLPAYRMSRLNPVAALRGVTT